MNWCAGLFHRWVASRYQHPDYMLIQVCERCGSIRRKEWPQNSKHLGGSDDAR